MKLPLNLWRRGSRVRTFASSTQHHHSRPPYNILFLGTDSFSLETLKALHLNRAAAAETRVVNTLHVVSTSAKTPVAEFARQHNLTLLTWPPELSSLDLYDLGVLVSFGRLVPGKVISRFPHGILNVHPSLLPRWRGASPIMHSVLNRDKETGVSIMSIQPSHFDTGPILLQRRTAVPEGCTAQDLAHKLATQGADMLLTTLHRMPESLRTAEPQSNVGVTYAHKARSSMAWVDWERHTDQQIKQQYRALAHMFPLRTSWNKQTLKLLDMVLDTEAGFQPSTSPRSHCPPSLERSEESSSAKEGTVVFDPHIHAVCVKCLEGWVAFRSLVLKKPMSATDFYNGYLSKDKHRDVCFDSHPNGLFEQGYWDFVRQRKAKKS